MRARVCGGGNVGTYFKNEYVHLIQFLSHHVDCDNHQIGLIGWFYPQIYWHFCLLNLDVLHSFILRASYLWCPTIWKLPSLIPCDYMAMPCPQWGHCFGTPTMIHICHQYSVNRLLLPTQHNGYSFPKGICMHFIF